MRNVIQGKSVEQDVINKQSNEVKALFNTAKQRKNEGLD